MNSTGTRFVAKRCFLRSQIRVQKKLCFSLGDRCVLVCVSLYVSEKYVMKNKIYQDVDSEMSPTEVVYHS